MENRGVIWHQNGQCPLGLAAYPTFDLPLDVADGGGSSLERQRWVPLRRLSPPLMGQLAWEECCACTWPGKQKTAFQTLCTDGLASLTYGTTVTRASRPDRLAEASWKFLFCDEMMIMMLRLQAARILACSSAACLHWRGLPRHMLPISWASSCKCFINYPPCTGIRCS